MARVMALPPAPAMLLRLFALVQLLALRADRARAWCLEDESGPCAFNIRSRAPDTAARAVKFFGKDDKPQGALEMTPASKELAILLGGDGAGDVCLRLTDAGYLALHSGAASSRPEFQLDVTNSLEPAVASFAGSPDKAGACAALRLENLPTKSAWTLFHDSVSKALGFTSTPERNPSALLAADAAVSWSAEAAPQSLVLDAEGQLTLTQVGTAENKHSRLVLGKARGNSPKTPQIVHTDDAIGSLQFHAYDGIKMRNVAWMTAKVDGRVAPGRIGSALELAVASEENEHPTPLLTLSSNGLKLKKDSHFVLEGSGSIHLESGQLLLDKGAATVGDSLTVGTGITVKAGGLNLDSGDLVVSGGTAQVKGDKDFVIERANLVLLSGSIKSRGGFASQGDIATEGAAQIALDTTVGGILRVEGKSAFFSGNADVQGQVTIGNGLKVDAGSIEFGGPVIVDSEMGLQVRHDGKVVLHASASASGVTVSGDTVVDGDVRAKSLRTGGDEGIHVGNGAPLAATGELNVGGESSFAGRVHVVDSTDATAPDAAALVVRGGLGVERGVVIGERLQIGPATFVSDGERTRLEGDLMHTSHLRLAAADIRIFAEPDATANSKTEPVFSVSSNGGHVSALGTVTATGGFETAHDVRAAQGQFRGDLQVDGNLLAHGPLEVSGTAQLKGEVVFEGNALFTDVLHAQHHDSRAELAGGVLRMFNSREENSNDPDPTVAIGATTGLSIAQAMQVAPGSFSVLAAATFAQDVTLTDDAALSLNGARIFAEIPSDGTFRSVTIDSILSLSKTLESEHVRIRPPATHTGGLSLDGADGPVLVQGKQEAELRSHDGASFKALAKPAGGSQAAVMSAGLESSLKLTQDALEVRVEAREDAAPVLVVNASHVALGGEQAKLSAANAEVSQLCGRPAQGSSSSQQQRSCVRFLPGGDIKLEAEPADSNPPHFAVHGSLTASGNILTETGFATKPRIIEMQASADFELQSYAGFVIIANCPRQADVGVILPAKDVPAGGSIAIQSQCAERFIPIKSGPTTEMFKLPALAVVHLVFDGAQWKLPSLPVQMNVALQEVQTLEAAAPLDVGPFEFAAGSFRSPSLAAVPLSGDPPRRKSGESDEDPDLGLAAISPNGTLTRTLPQHMRLASNGTLIVPAISGHRVDGPLALDGNQILNASIQGGSIRGITELQVSTSIVSHGTIAEASDRRLKVDIDAVGSDVALRKVLQLEGVTYREKENLRSGRHLGLLAQDVEAVVPEVVQTDAVSGMKAVQYARLVPLLVESIKALEARVAALEARLAQAHTTALPAE